MILFSGFHAVAEFEQKWAAMVELYGLRDHEDMIDLWEHRECWVPAYFVHDFYPFLQTTARSEGFNAVLKKYVNPQNSVVEFVRQYTSIQAKIFVAGNKEEHETVAKDTDLWGYNPIEVQMHSMYTHNIFCIFQRELRQTTSYHCEHIEGTRYTVISLRGRIAKYGERSYEVDANKVDGIYSCECCKYERDGLLCCHILRVMTQIGVYAIPERYVMKRWTFDAEEDVVDPCAPPPTRSRDMPEEGKRTMRYANQKTKFNDIAKEGCLSDDADRIVMSHLKAAKSELAALKRSQKKKAMTQRANTVGMPPPPPPPATSVIPHAYPNTPNMAGESSDASNTRMIRDPPRSSTKGRPQMKAFQHPLDIVKQPKGKKVRKCRLCGGTDHDARNCKTKDQPN